MNENIVKLNYKDKEIYLVKTAHVSKNSINDVKECIGEVKPDAIPVFRLSHHKFLEAV